jgi:outer membrane protein insertion porin family
MSAGFDLYQTHALYEESNYESDVTGFGLRLGFPVSEFGRVGLRYTLRRDDITVSGVTSPDLFGAMGVNTLSLFGYTYSYDQKDDPLEPKNGFDFAFNQDIAGLGGDKKYIRTEVASNYYQRLGYDELVLNLAATAGYLYAFDDNDTNANDRFFKGGGSFRGFETSGVGPRDTAYVTRNSVGGELYAIGTVELRFPNFLPEELGIKTSLFTDFGTVGLVADKPLHCNKDPDGAGPMPVPFPLEPISCIEDDLSLRASAGVSVYWNSPFGPVRLDFSQILSKEDYDKTEGFRFSAGTKF